MRPPSRLTCLGPRLRPSDTRTSRPAPKVAAAHYQTDAHQQWRSDVIRRAGGMCQAPGCSRTGTRLFADHVIELRDGGAALDLANGQALCGSCHTRKTAAARAARQARPAERRGGSNP